MDASKLVFNIFSIIFFSLLMFSATALGGLLYAYLFQDEMIKSLETAFVKDISKRPEFDTSYLSLDNMKLLCSIGIKNSINMAKQMGEEVDPQLEAFAENEEVICAYIDSGKIKTNDELKEYLVEMYFKTVIKKEIEKSIFDQVPGYLFLFSVGTIILFIIQIVISMQSEKKSFVFSLVVGLISLIAILYFSNTLIDKQIDLRVGSETLKEIPNVIKVVKYYLKEFITYSFIFGFIVANLSSMLGILIKNRTKKEHNKKKPKKKKNKTKEDSELYP